MKLETLLKRIDYKVLQGNTDIEISDVIKMDEPFNYRNKLQYPVGLDNNGNPVMGVFAERTHSIISTKECNIQD